MRALTLEDFGHLSIVDMTDPVAESDNVVVRVAATGICGSDIHGYTGDNGRRSPGQVMGHETVGVIESVGSGLTRTDLAPGMIVTVNPVILPAENVQDFAGREQHDPMKRVLGVAPEIISAFAEKILVPERNVIVLSPRMPILHGALIEPLAVAVNAVRRADARPGNTVLVLGGGPIGQSIVLALQMAGIDDIFVTEVLPSRQDLLHTLGATVIDPTTQNVADAVYAASGSAADVALDAVGITETLDDALAATKLGGTVCLVGMGGQVLQVDAFKVSTAERSVVGSFTYSNPDFEAAAAWLATAPHSADLLISRCVSMEQAGDAFAQLAAGDDTAGKVLVILDPAQVASDTASDQLAGA